MKITVEMSDIEVTEILKYSNERKKGPAIRSLAIESLNYRKRLAMNAKFHSGEWGIEIPRIEEIRKDRPLWDR